MPEKRERRPADEGRRAELIDAAATVIARDGVYAATTRAIAKEAGLPQGMVHYWFSGKDELLEEVLGGTLRDIEASATTAIEPSADLAEDLRSRFLAALGVVRSADPGEQLSHYELTTWALRSPKTKDFARRQYEAYRVTAAATISTWLARMNTEFPGGNEALIRLVATLFDGVVLAWLADPEGTHPEEIFRLASDLIVGAVRNTAR
jgi:AcrR family transcriptional regulator